VSDDYDPAEDARKCYDVAIAAKRARGDKHWPVPASQKKGNKFGAVKTVLDGITFDSKREAAFYAELKLRERAGEVCDVELQPRFPLMVGSEVIGSYRADFAYWDNRENCKRVVDVKGVEPRGFRRTLKHVKAQYGFDVEIIK